MKTIHAAMLGILSCGQALAAEVTVQNDALTNFATATIEAGFAAGEKGASWLTSPCAGNIVAVQLFWLSLNGTSGQTLGDTIEIFRAGTYPNPGSLAQHIDGPVLTDGVLNEYRYLDDNNTVPLSVPVTANETFVVSYRFGAAPPGTGPSLVVDNNGIQGGRNAIFAFLGGNTFLWLSSETFQVPGDWVIRAVVDCQAAGSSADVASTISTSPPLYTPGAAISHAMSISNGGPGNAASVVVVDAFPAAYTGVTWSCVASGGASCTSGGSGNLSQVINLPAGSQVTYTVNATVAPGSTGVLSNSVTAVVNSPATDPNSANNTATANTAPLSDRIFADGFDPSA